MFTLRLKLASMAFRKRLQRDNEVALWYNNEFYLIQYHKENVYKHDYRYHIYRDITENKAFSQKEFLLYAFVTEVTIK